MKKMLFASAALACILAAAPANAAIVTNGSFELGTNPGAFTTVNAIKRFGDHWLDRKRRIG